MHPKAVWTRNHDPILPLRFDSLQYMHFAEGVCPLCPRERTFHEGATHVRYVPKPEAQTTNITTIAIPEFPASWILIRFPIRIDLACEDALAKCVKQMPS